MRTFGSPKTPRTTGSGRNPSNEYVSQSRRRRFDRLTIHNLCQILNPAKMQNIPEIPRPVPLQALKSTHSIPRRPKLLYIRLANPTAAGFSARHQERIETASCRDIRRFKMHHMIGDEERIERRRSDRSE